VGSVASGLGVKFALGDTLGGTEFAQSVAPSWSTAAEKEFARAYADGLAAGEDAVATTEEVIVEADAIGGEIAGTGVGVIVAAVIFAVTTAIEVGLAVILPSQIPDQIAATIAKARTTVPNPYDMATSNPAGLFGVFAGALLPQPLRTRC